MKNGLPFTILVVEDDADDRVIIDDAFKEVGYEAEVKKFTDGPSLLRYMEQINATVYPSLIVLDNSLPGLEVQDVLLNLKEHYQAIPVIIYSGPVSARKKGQLMELGAFDIIEKGYSMQEVINIAQHLKEVAESHNPTKTQG
jgi:DNA-binding NtrC family response regulator